MVGTKTEISYFHINKITGLMMRIDTFFWRISFILGVLILVSCRSTFNVQSEDLYARDFSGFKTFKFFNPQNMPEANFAFSNTNKKRIYDAVAAEMKKRGYTSIQDADLIIKIQGGTSREIQKNNSTYYSPYGYGYRAYDPYYWTRDPWMYDDISNKKTMIMIDILDAGSKKLLWQGTGLGVLSQKKDMVEEDLQRAIIKIFTQFPVPVKESN